MVPIQITFSWFVCCYYFKRFYRIYFPIPKFSHMLFSSATNQLHPFSLSSPLSLSLPHLPLLKTHLKQCSIKIKNTKAHKKHRDLTHIIWWISTYHGWYWNKVESNGEFQIHEHTHNPDNSVGFKTATINKIEMKIII